VYTSQSHCACTHLALQGREWPWGSHPTATTWIVKVAMLKCYYEAIAEICRVDDSFHVCVYHFYMQISEEISPCMCIREFVYYTQKRLPYGVKT